MGVCVDAEGARRGLSITEPLALFLLDQEPVDFALGDSATELMAVLEAGLEGGLEPSEGRDNLALFLRYEDGAVDAAEARWANNNINFIPPPRKARKKTYS